MNSAAANQKPGKYDPYVLRSRPAIGWPMNVAFEIKIHSHEMDKYKSDRFLLNYLGLRIAVIVRMNFRVSLIQTDRPEWPIAKWRKRQLQTQGL